MSGIVTESFEALQLHDDGDLLWVTLSDPKRANALSPAMVAGLTRIYSTDLRQQGFRAVLLQGEGKHFSAGADLEHLRSLLDAGAEQNRQDSEALRSLFECVLRQEALTVALVSGACVAGGCGLATAHDFVVAAENARFMYSEVRIGFVAALVATYLPLRLKGADIRELLLNPEFVDAESALEMGLANRLVRLQDLSAAGRSLALEILERASSESIARTKRLLLQVLGRPLDQALQIAVEANAEARATADCQHGIATFLETKSTPNWRQR
jgi:methylglutaconyl-CoA hydratase